MVQLPVVDGLLCERMWTGALFSPQNQLCVGRRQGGADTCSGDSGGALLALWQDPGGGPPRPGAVVGIVSFGHGCAQAKSYSIYTRVSAYAAWLADSVVGFASAAAAPATPGAAPVLDPPAGATVCETARTGAVAVLDCGAQVIAAIEFASYGNPSGARPTLLAMGNPLLA